jgi:MFS family permease
VLIRLGWKATMIIGILGHAARFLVFAFFPDSVPTIITVQLLHGICYAFFFATVYIFVDAAFPKDVRSSAQGLFNLLILGVGNVAASFLFPALMAQLTIPGAEPGTTAVDYRTLFMVPAGMAVVAILLMAVFFRPTERAPARTHTAAQPAAAE